MEHRSHTKKYGLIAFIAVIVIVAVCSVGIFFSGHVKRAANTVYGWFLDFVNYDDRSGGRMNDDDALLASYSSPVMEHQDMRALEIVVPELDTRSENADGIPYSEYILPQLNVQLQYASENGFTHILYKTSLYAKKDYDVLVYLREQTSGMGLGLIIETDLLTLHAPNDEDVFDAERYTPTYEIQRGGFWKRLFFPESSARKVAVSGIDPKWIYISDSGAKCLNPAYNEMRDFASSELRAALEKYSPDMLLLDAPKYDVRNISEDDIPERSVGMTVEELHRRSTELMTIDVSKLIDEAFPDVAFGIRADRVWKTSAADSKGINIASGYSDFVNGCADTLGWCERGYVDFVVAGTTVSMPEGDEFLTMLEWWKDVESRTGVSFICAYDANMINTTVGWSGYYELANEYDAATQRDCISGIFADYDAFALHPDEAELLVKVFENTIDFGISDEVLKLTSPADKITVDVPVIAVSGTCDNNFAITINGKTVEPTERGFFATDIPLSAGKNVITVEHKGQTITRTVNYNLVIIKDIAPTGELSVMGGTGIEYTVTARKGAKVTGTLNGQTVRFTEQPPATEGKSDEDVFVPFTGVFSAPPAKSAAYSIGSAKVTASFEGFVKSLKGASVTVLPAASSVGNIAVVKVDKAESFRAEPANSDTSLPQYFWLPKGTRDYIVGESVYSGSDGTKKYYLLKCGLRVYQTDVTLEEGSIPVNSTSKVALTDEGKYTYLTFANSQHVPYKLVMNGLFPSGDTNATTASSANFSSLDVVLCNTAGETSVSGGSTALMSFASSSSNSSAQTVTYSFKLAKNGGFYGFTSYYNENGNLVIRFRNPIKASGGRLEGIRICLDPGHGGVDSGAPGFNGAYEANENLMVALALKKELEALGATVFMTRSNNQTYSDGTPITSSTLRLNRIALIASYNVDLLISVHHNSSTSITGNGTEALYFYGFNQKLAQTVSDSMAAVSGMKNRGGKYQNVFVYRTHDFMSILLECGFLSNPNDSDWLAAPGHTDKLANAIANAVVDYFS